MIQLKEEDIYSDEESIDFLKKLLNNLTQRFTIFYEISKEERDFYFINVKFNEPTNKTPITPFEVQLTFKVPKNHDIDQLTFNIKNESLFFPYNSSINLDFLPTIIDRITNNKYKISQLFMLHTNFETTRIVSKTGDLFKYYTIDEEENIFTNNNSDFFKEKFYFGPLETNDLSNILKNLWKYLSNKENFITFEEFKNLFIFGKINFSPENLNKLWKYVDKYKRNQIKYNEFVPFFVDLFQCLRAFEISQFQIQNNNYIKNKIERAVEIMNQHFIEYDYECNQEISFEDFEICLNKENEIFSKKEVEIILKQINKDHKFEYWKFNKILEHIYHKYFDYKKLMKEDKIYKYLITLFNKLDKENKGKLCWKKIKQGLLIQPKLKMNKIQVNLIFFNTNIDLNNFKLFQH